MTAPETPAAQHAEPAIAVERIRTALLGYRIMAWTTGLWLIALCYEIVVRYVVKVDNPPTWIGVVHGWVYFTYLLLTLNLAVKVRWPLGKTAGVLLAGTIPLPAGLPVGQHVVEHEPVAIPDALGGQLAALDQTHHGRTTHPEKVGGLLGGQRHALRRDGHRLAGVQRSHHLP